MDNWWAWTSDDLVNWQKISTLQPEQTYIGKPSRDCWATDAATRNGKYYWYFSAGRNDIGVVEARTPGGPWKDTLGKLLSAKGLTPTAQRAPGILMDDDGENYIVYGTWEFYLAHLGDDMMSLAEKPRLLQLDTKFGPYGAGKTDDKPFLHKYNGKYYLSWGCFYAMADNPYGPYTYKGSVIVPGKIEPTFVNNKVTYDRHGSSFEFKGQWYFICNDFSRPGASDHYRDSIISYVHCRANGEIAPLEITRTGVGSYDASGPIEAENYFQITGATPHENAAGGFEVRGLTNASALFYPRVAGIPQNAVLRLRVANGSTLSGEIEVRENDEKGKLLGTVPVPATGGWGQYQEVQIPLVPPAPTTNLAFYFRGPQGEWARLDWWQLQTAA